ncbi:GNAT family N-acetyltransferase [Cohnella hongkongensis]|uniref:GNAT family N-acetyltransferase n=1 Tax=Cohnella hongkongensis TaxID=178337 RepID=A0ABV9FFT4_9BACL
MTVDIRRIRPEEYPEAVKLADEVFRDGGGKSMGATYPMAFSGAYRQSYGAFEADRLVSFIGLVPNIIRIGAAELRVCSIGAVCTRSEDRGRGYASMILERVLAHMRAADAPLLLVSGGRPLYRRIGCEEFGVFYRYRIGMSQAGRLAAADTSGSAVTIRELQPEDGFELRRLSRTRVARYEQSLWDLATLIEAEAPAANAGLRNKVLVAESAAVAPHRLIGYIVLGTDDKSAAAAGRRESLAVEWAGSAAAVAALFAEGVRTSGGAGLQANVPWQEADLLAVLNALSSPPEPVHNEGTALITDAEAFVRQLRPYWEASGLSGSESMRVEQTGDRVAVSIGERSARMSRVQFLQLAFEGHVPPEADRRLEEALRRLFPIPFPSTAGINFV